MSVLDEDPTLKSLRSLDDPSEWVVVPNVPVFDEHTEDVWVPEAGEDGRPLRDADGRVKKKKVRWDCDTKELAEICRVNNAREKTGDLSVLTIGHTEDGAPESEQPPVIGVARNWRVREYGPEKRKAAVHDWYLDRYRLCGGKSCSDAEALQKAKQLLRSYPRRSIELWRGSKVVDPISLLGASTPERPLGMTLTFAKTPDRIRYSKEGYAMDSEPEVPGMAGAAPEAPEGAEAPGYTPEMHHEYMKHCYSHKYAKPHHEHMLSKYAAAEEPAEEHATAGAPAPEEAVPAPKSAYAAGPGAGPAAPATDKPRGQQKFQKATANGEAPDRYARLQRDLDGARELLATLMKRDQERGQRELALAKERDLERYARVIAGYVESEGVDLTDEEVQQEATEIVGMTDDAARQARLSRIRSKYSKRPTGRLPANFHALPHSVEGGVAPPTDQPKDQQEYEEAIKYASNYPKDIDHGAPDLMAEAVRKYRKWKSVANGR